MATQAGTATWQDLITQLTDLKKKYDRLLLVLKKKETLIIDGKEKKLSILVKEEESLINDIEKIELKRIKVADACKPEGFEGVPTLKDLIEIVPEELHGKLEKVALELLAIMNTVSLANHGVAELVKEAMNFVTYQINLLGSDSAQENIYSGNGRMREKPPGKIRGIINREA